MSAGVIIAITVGGLILFAAAIIVMLVWLRRSYESDEKAALGRLQEEMPQRGWTFEERNDSYTQVRNHLSQYRLGYKLRPDLRPAEARKAHNVVTGWHRGRPFLAATFDIYQPVALDRPGRSGSIQTIWVRAPRLMPPLGVRRVLAAESAVNRAIGQGDLQTGNADFDQQFEIKTENEQFARAVLNPEMVRFLLADSRSFRGFWLVGDQIEVLDAVTDHRDPAELIPALDLRCDILDRIPQSVWA